MPTAAPAAPPTFIAPCKPKLQAKAPSGPRWLAEIKFDGHRVHARRDRGKAVFRSANGHDYTAKAGPDLVAVVHRLPAAQAYIDAELVVENELGISDFGLLQADLAARRADRLLLYAFDLLWLDREDLRSLPLIERKASLERLMATFEPAVRLRLSEHFDEADGSALMRHACDLGVEGVVSKLRHSRYTSGPSASWVKAICRKTGSLVIAGYQLDSIPGRVGSVFLGETVKGKRYYRGHVSVPVDAKSREVASVLATIRREGNPFADKSTKEFRQRGVRFVEPKVWVKVTYRGITEAGRLRHASFVDVEHRPGRAKGARKPPE